MPKYGYKNISKREENNAPATNIKESVLIADGNYKSDKELILRGYKIYQKKYVLARVLFRLVLVIFAAASSIMMMITGGVDTVFSALLLIACISLGWYFLTEPLGNKKKLIKTLELLEGTEYNAKIYNDKVVISTESLNDIDSDINSDTGIEVNNSENEDNQEQLQEELQEELQEDIPPATVINLNYHIVDLLDREDMFIICVRKSYVFVIPKSAFNEDEISAVRERLAEFMGLRYKIYE